jgi:putative transposase
MARLPRLVLPGRAHYIIQRGHSGGPVFADDVDRRAFLDALRESSAAHGVAVHAYALPAAEVQLLATPPSAAALSATMQSLGRRYVGAYNRRHGHSGTLWDGRFRCAVVEGGGPVLSVLQLIDGLPEVAGPADEQRPPSAGPRPTWSSAGHRLGASRWPWLVDPPELWPLGNTPFEREASWRALLMKGMPAAEAAVCRSAALGGRAIGSPAFLHALAADTARPLLPRPRGRPRRNPIAP